jgi:uncharacterized protein YbaP (TraB family)
MNLQTSWLGARAIGAAILLGAFLFAQAGAETPPTLAEGAAKYAGQSATPPMWRLADENSEVWLLGTFHILPAGLDWRPDTLVAAADSADTLWFEAEVDTLAAGQKAAQILLTQGFNKPGVTLVSILGPEDGARLAKVADEVGLPMAAVDPMRPWQAFLRISINFIVAQGFDPASGVETVLLKEAKARGKDLKFFESIEQQMGLFTGLAPATEKKLLVLTLHEWENQKADFDALFEAWRTGDATAIDTLMNQPMRAAAPDVYEVLVEKRNADWADQIAAAMAGSGRILVAVGAGHLVGENSVPALLEAKGFTVERYGLPAVKPSE